MLPVAAFYPVAIRSFWRHEFDAGASRIHAEFLLPIWLQQAGRAVEDEDGFWE
jgi:hypothetical protein